MAQTTMARVLLIVDSLIKTPAKTLMAMNANGLATRDAVKQNESGNKRYQEDSQTAQATGQENWFSCVHISLHFPHTITQG